MYKLFTTAIDQNIKIIYIDEYAFTFNTFSRKAWAAPHSTLSISEASLHVKSHALIAGISEDYGLESFLIALKSIRTE